MTNSDARRKAEACFAVARSSTFEGEKRNAVNRGITIAERAGLDLSSFDIPGRPRQPPPAKSRFVDDLFTRPRSPFYDPSNIASAELFEEMADLLRTMNSRRTQEARDAATIRAERDRRSALVVDRAASFLFEHGVRCHPANAERTRWIIDDEDKTASQLLNKARVYGFQP